MFGYMGYIVIAGLFSLVGWWISNHLTSNFNIYSQNRLAENYSGKEIAEKMLHYYGIYDVEIVPARGFLSDHYNPANKTVNLSPEVFEGRSVMAAAVAAHECGHAVQRATHYTVVEYRLA